VFVLKHDRRLMVDVCTRVSSVTRRNAIVPVATRIILVNVDVL
jgi:hypothetical protein